MYNNNNKNDYNNTRILVSHYCNCNLKVSHHLNKFKKKIFSLKVLCCLIPNMFNMSSKMHNNLQIYNIVHCT